MTPQKDCYFTPGVINCRSPAPRPDPKKTVERNRFVCSLLAQEGWSFDNAHQRVLHLRNPDIGPKSWNNDTYRNAENFLSAALMGYSDAEIWAYQNLIKPLNLQTDPIGYADGLNWYNYVGGDPVNFSDPRGFCAGWIDENGRPAQNAGDCVVLAPLSV